VTGVVGDVEGVTRTGGKVVDGELRDLVGREEVMMFHSDQDRRRTSSILVDVVVVGPFGSVTEVEAERSVETAVVLCRSRWTGDLRIPRTDRVSTVRREREQASRQHHHSDDVPRIPVDVH
jgi:hypothetical protein